MAGLLALALGAVLVAGAPPSAPRVHAATTIPAEPGVEALPDDLPTIQAVAADLDGDGARELCG